MHSFLKLVADGLPRLPIAQCGANKGTSTCLLASAPKRITAVVVIMIMDIIRHELSLRIFEPSVAPQLALSNKESGCGPQKLFRLLLEEEECKTNYSFTIRDCQIHHNLQ